MLLKSIYFVHFIYFVYFAYFAYLIGLNILYILPRRSHGLGHFSGSSVPVGAPRAAAQTQSRSQLMFDRSELCHVPVGRQGVKRRRTHGWPLISSSRFLGEPYDA